ncbi:MAG: cyclase family protein [Clostridia bacterium]|nr:cyclase family protein [Clostridia bacterium]
MQIFDISQEVFSCAVYPGDPAPAREVLASLDAGDVCNLTSFSMCAHNGTHIDAPAHFIKDGATVDALPLDVLIGKAVVISHTGDITADDAHRMLETVGNIKKLLIKGNATLSLEAAEVLARAGLDLYGNESQTVGPESAPMAVHLSLLGAGVVLLEGIRLSHVPDGIYLLHAAPINLGGADGAPCRATLLKL